MTEELANELDASRGDESLWKREAAEVEVRPSGSQVVSFRMPNDEFDQLMEDAASSGESISEYIRGAIRLHHLATAHVHISQLSGDLSRWSRFEIVGNENPAGPSEVEPLRSVSI